MIKLLAALLATGKLGKVALSGGTMLLSIFAYGITFGWPYACGLVGMIFVHEMGHFLAARRHGLDVGAPVFIPFVGAWVSIKDPSVDVRTMAHVALAGPVLGSVAAFLSYLYYDETREPLWLAIAYAGFVLNLVNLIPIGMLDGGRIVKIVSTRIWLAGVPLLAAAFLWQPSPLLLMIGIIALPELWQAMRGRVAPVDPRVPLSVRVQTGAAYLGLAVALAILSYQAHDQLRAMGH
jgi:Zn-dependent protease